MTRCIVVGIENSTHIKPVKVFLEELGLFNRNKKINRSGNLHQLYTTCKKIEELEGIPGNDVEIGYYEKEESDKGTLEGVVRGFLTNVGFGGDVEKILEH